VEHGQDDTTEHMPLWRMPYRNLPTGSSPPPTIPSNNMPGFEYPTLRFWNNGHRDRRFD